MLTMDQNSAWFVDRTRVARFFFVKIYQIGEKIPNDQKLNQTTVNYIK
jgi:hypothetical protein